LDSGYSEMSTQSYIRDTLEHPGIYYYELTVKDAEGASSTALQDVLTLSLDAPFKTIR